MPQTLGLDMFLAQVQARNAYSQQLSQAREMAVRNAAIVTQSQIQSQNRMFDAINNGIANIAAAQMRAADMKFRVTSDLARIDYTAQKQAERDAQLHTDRMDEINEHYTQRMAEKEYEQTGYTEGEIAQMSADSAKNGPPVPVPVLREQLRNQKLQADTQARLEANYNAVLSMVKSGKDLTYAKEMAQDQANLKSLNALRSGDTMGLRPDQVPVAIQTLENQHMRFVTGLPPAKVGDDNPPELRDQQTGELYGWIQPDGRIAQRRNVAGSSGLASSAPGVGKMPEMDDYQPTEDDIKNHLEGLGEFKPGALWGSNPKKYEDYNEEDKRIARISIKAKVRQEKMFDMMVMGYQSAGARPEEAVAWAKDDIEKKQLDVQLQRYMQSVKSGKMTREFAAAHGIPMRDPSSQPAPQSQPAPATAPSQSSEQDVRIINGRRFRRIGADQWEEVR